MTGAKIFDNDDNNKKNEETELHFILATHQFRTLAFCLEIYTMGSGTLSIVKE